MPVTVRNFSGDFDTVYCGRLVLFVVVGDDEIVRCDAGVELKGRSATRGERC